MTITKLLEKREYKAKDGTVKEGNQTVLLSRSRTNSAVFETMPASKTEKGYPLTASINTELTTAENGKPYGTGTITFDGEDEMFTLLNNKFHVFLGRKPAVA